jgi:hypothetical protein
VRPRQSDSMTLSPQLSFIEQPSTIILRSECGATIANRPFTRGECGRTGDFPRRKANSAVSARVPGPPTPCLVEIGGLRTLSTRGKNGVASPVVSLGRVSEPVFGERSGAATKPLTEVDTDALKRYITLVLKLGIGPERIGEYVKLQFFGEAQAQWAVQLA